MVKYLQKPIQNDKDFLEHLKDILDKYPNDFFQPKINKLDISNVEQKDLAKDKPMLQFQDSDDVIENICNVESLDDGLKKMKRIFEDSNYTKSQYIRVVDHYDYYWIDYGSHTCFFRVTKVKGGQHG